LNIRGSEHQKEMNRGSDASAKQREEQKRIIPRHEKLWVWQKAHKLMIEVFLACKTLPQAERYRLIDQAQRSSKSVADNIAEGCHNYYFNGKIKSYYDSRKEAGETQNHIREMESKKYLHPIRAQKLIEDYGEVIRGINGLINKTCELREIFKSKGIKRI